MNMDLDGFLFELYQKTEDPIIFVDSTGRIISLNLKAQSYFGYTEAELIGRKVEVLVPGPLRSLHQQEREDYQKHPSARKMGSGMKLQAQHKNGNILDVDISLCPLTTPSGQKAIVAIIRDVQAYREYEKILVDRLNHDTLTGVMTGSYLQHKVQELLEEKEHFDNLFALCIIDIDNFKEINDRYGHDAGNKILQDVAQGLKNSSRRGDVVARLGGDEFILLLNNFKNKADIEATVKKIHHSVTQCAYPLDGKQLKIGLSIGVSIFPNDAKKEAMLFKKADIAMYSVKNGRKNDYAFFEPLKLTQHGRELNGTTHLEFDKLDNFISFPLFKANLNKNVGKEDAQTTHFILVGIDNFKGINHIFGYETADHVLSLIAERIYQIVQKENCVLTRKSGDEFAILLLNSSKQKTTQLAKSMIAEIAKPFQLGAESLYVTASIGVSCYPDDAKDRSELLTHSDVALQGAKSLGKNTLRFYNLRDGLHLKKMQILRNALPHALQNKELFLCYQMQYDVVDNRIIGAEALLRWRHPTLGLISPDVFIPLIENTLMINTISDWVLNEACQQAKRWQQWVKDFLISVNVSTSQLTPLFVQSQYKITNSVQAALEKSGLSPQSLELEITEGIMLDGKSTSNVLHKLKKLNVRLACDDFGQNFSSFNRLQDVPLSTIKIHQHLIEEIAQKTIGYTLVDAVIKIAKTLNLRLVAEGVTEKAQVDMLKTMGCRYIQGYYYSKPVKAKQFEARLKRDAK